ncbi:MAG: IS3 family transposase [Akkermansia sp.]|nr:IS3 family transposase [Akkermansia sp.]
MPVTFCGSHLSSDITYLQIGAKNYYLCIVMDWESRYVLGWSISEKMDMALCLSALEMALSKGRLPKYFNTDQGSQYTSRDWQECMEENGIIISQDGKGRWADNIVMERLWRTYKYEFFFIREPSNIIDLQIITAQWLDYYNNKRPHETLENKTPSEYRREQGIPTPHPANFFSDFSAPALLASLRAAPSLSSGRRAYATKSLKKWIDNRTIQCY